MFGRRSSVWVKKKDIYIPIENRVDWPHEKFGSQPVKTLYFLHPRWFMLPFRHTVTAVYDGSLVGVPNRDILVRIGHPGCGPRGDASEIECLVQMDGMDRYTVIEMHRDRQKRIRRELDVMPVWEKYG